MSHRSVTIARISAVVAIVVLVAVAIPRRGHATRHGLDPAAAALLRTIRPAKPSGTRLRVAVLVLENRSYGQVIGNRDAPFLNRLARRYALATNYYALAHPSLPNYVALTSGSTRGAMHDNARRSLARLNLVDELDAARLSWRGGFPSPPGTRDPRGH